MEVPRPLVKKPRLLRYEGLELGVREGKGFSIGELREAGLSPIEAKALGLPVDRRRKTKWDVNVKALKNFLEKIGYKS